MKSRRPLNCKTPHPENTAAAKNWIKKVVISIGALAIASSALATVGKPEKWELKFGFIKLTDMVPLAVAYEKGYFEDEGLFVTLEAQANWKVLFDRVVSGELDGAHMLAPMPVGAAAGVITKAEIIAPFTLSYNGAAITVANSVWQEMKKAVPVESGKPKHPIGAEALKPVLEEYKKAGKPFNLAMTFPVGTHNYLERYWLAAGGINPGFYAPAKGDNSGNLNAEAVLSVVPPPQMVPTMEAGTTVGYCVGEPWNQQAVFKGLGVPVITSENIWPDGADKVFGVTKTFADKYPNTTIRAVKALIRASAWLDANNNINRPEAVKIIARPAYVGADEKVIANSMTGTFEFEKGDKRPIPDFNKFFRGTYGMPYYSDAVWWTTQMRRWGHIAEQKPDSWYMEIAKKAYRPDIYVAAARELIAEGKMKASDFPDLDKATFFKPPQKSPLDGIEYDGTKPNAYLDKFAIGLKGGEKI
ncbi:MAG TPA: CmpA/NrtA family ABC transporter substrate-binding protein [Spongiibacteraceae bacterium]|nr:CmpA/NrtA family ABC transporter substrate-binding protein [Spongiibacteraceae bacterium]